MEHYFGHIAHPYTKYNWKKKSFLPLKWEIDSYTIWGKIRANVQLFYNSSYLVIIYHLFINTIKPQSFFFFFRTEDESFSLEVRSRCSRGSAPRSGDHFVNTTQVLMENWPFLKKTKTNPKQTWTINYSLQSQGRPDGGWESWGGTVYTLEQCLLGP